MNGVVFGSLGCKKKMRKGFALREKPPSATVFATWNGLSRTIAKRVSDGQSVGSATVYIGAIKALL